MMPREMLSAAADPIAEVVVLALVGAVAAGKAVSYAYKQNELEKEKEYYEAITKLYKQYLGKPPIAGGKVLPPIFSNGTEEKPTPTTSIQIEVLEDLYSISPPYNDPHLRDYGHHVLNAMRSLAKYYDWRLKGRDWLWKGNKNDFTSAVLSYLILMLSEHCVKFEGYDVDIEILHNLAEFTNAFASMKRPMHDERFEHLTEAYTELLEAKAILVNHSASLSMEEMISEFESRSGNIAERMIRLFSKLILPKEDWNTVDFASIDHIAGGDVSPKYKYGQSLSHFFGGSATLLPDTVLSEWVEKNAQDYINSLPVNKGFELAIEGQKCKMLDKNEKDYKEKLTAIKKIFKASTNALTLTVKEREKSNATKKFTAVEKDEEVESRVGVFYNFYQLTDRVIVAQYLCSHIWRQIRQLGEVYVTDSQHCDFIFQVLEGLGKQQEDFASKISRDLQEIELSFSGAMQENDANVLLTEFRDLLAAAKALSVSINEIVKKHNSRRETAEVKLPVNLDGKDKLLSLTHEISKAYEINTGHEVLLQAPVPLPRPSAEEIMKTKRKDDPAVNALYTTIYQMRSYGQSLLTKDKKLGQVAVTLANALEDKVDNFYGMAVDAKPDRQALDAFKTEFTTLLNSKNTEMTRHRAAWKPIVANIALALTGIGLVFLVGKLIYSGCSEGKATLFFSKTKREQHLEQIQASVNNIAAAV